MVGCLGSFFVDALDTRINTSKDAQRATGRPPSGALPYFKPAKSLGEHDGQSRLISVSNPGSPFTEAVRALRTALSSTNLEGRPRVILVTSSVAGEGKTVLSSNLAVLMAQSGLRGLLVDTDMRHGGLQHILNIPDRPGLSELLTGKREPPDALPMEGQPCLAVLTAGQVPSNPSELLSSKAFETLMSKWRKQYDFVVLDSTPLLPVTDSIVVSRLADITLVLVRLGVTEQGQVERSCHLLNCPGGSDSVGIVLNGMRPDDENYSGYFG